MFTKTVCGSGEVHTNKGVGYSNVTFKDKIAEMRLRKEIEEKPDSHHLKINDVFGPTIQGEGRSTGQPVIFIRLSTCNLYCSWCDTPYTWNWTGTKFAHPIKYDRKDEVHRLPDKTILDEVRSKSETIKRIVVSGGEPLLQQKQLVSLLQELKRTGHTTEIETNGTIAPSDEVIELVEQFNCSPKLANSGVLLQQRFKPEALTKLSECGKASFKFVVTSDKDIPEILSLVKEFKMKEVYLMPEGLTKEALLEKTEKVQALCKEHNFHFSQRVHIIELGGGRRV